MRYLVHEKRTDLYLKHFKNIFLNSSHKNSDHFINLSNIFQNFFKLQCSELSQGVGHGQHEAPSKGREIAPQQRT